MYNYDDFECPNCGEDVKLDNAIFSSAETLAYVHCNNCDVMITYDYNDRVVVEWSGDDVR